MVTTEVLLLSGGGLLITPGDPEALSRGRQQQASPVDGFFVCLLSAQTRWARRDVLFCDNFAYIQQSLILLLVMMKQFPLWLAAVSVMFAGCVQSIAVSTVGGIVDEGFSAFTEEDDLAFAEQALPGNLKLLDVMLKSEPENERLLRLASEGYSSYALAFLEEESPDRARSFYLRGRDYGLRLLRQQEDIAKALDGSPDDLRAALAEQDRDLAPAAFWTAFGWGGYINITLTSPDAIADLPRAEALMAFVAEHDSSYYFGGADLFLGALYGSRPKLLGGDAEKSRAHFERALRLNEGKFLMTHVYYARSYAVQTQDEVLFEELLTAVEETPLDVLPDYRLANAVAKEKAARLLARKSELF